MERVGKDNWGKMSQVLARLDQALDRGVRISFDQYPYEASSTTLSLLLPGWAMQGGWEGFRKTMDSAESRERILAQISLSIEGRGGREAIKIGSAQCQNGSVLAGKSLRAIAGMWSIPVEEAVCRILLDTKLGAIAIYHAMSPRDVESAMIHPLHCVGSDGVLGDCPHPRAYGTFPRVISHFHKTRGLFPLEEAIRKMTFQPAKIMNLSQRGMIKTGNFADLLIFDPLAFTDNATYDYPKEPPSGLDWVFINGNPVLVEGRLEHRFPGQVLRPETIA
jgi:N-acyl-D-amino-acid deacylase